MKRNKLGLIGDAQRKSNDLERASAIADLTGLIPNAKRITITKTYQKK